MKSKNDNFYFQNGSEYLNHFSFTHRNGEKRVGDVLNYASSARFQLIGIKESIGPQLNLGYSGAENGFEAFLQQFCLTQIHESFSEDLFSLAGIISITNDKTLASSELIYELDSFVFDVLESIIKPGQIPIVIGGGHNNALPIIRWATNDSKFAVVNIDPHADTREINDRHSGNSFSIAINEGKLTHYHVLGLHEAYNNSYIRDYLKNNAKFYSFFEEYLFTNRKITDDIQQISSLIGDIPCGFELDMDAVANFPSSAISPSGWTLDDMRQILHALCKGIGNISYLHLPESAPKNQQEFRMCGKALSYLVRDFIQHLTN